MEKVQRMLMIDFWFSVALVLIIVLLGELNVVPFDSFNGGKQTEFYLLTVMELLTIGLIPLALRLFKINKVKQELREGQAQALSKWAVCRLDMLCIPMLINAVLYYIYMNAAFGYLAIILFLCLFFIYPSKTRCQSELNLDEESK